jgi:formylglycine-generating enzyme required for sulfatase activity
MDLHEEIQRFLEGEKERERNRQRAQEKVREGKVLVESLEKMRAELTSLERKVADAAGEIQPHWPVERKTDFWDLQDRTKTIRREIVRRFSIAGTIFQSALSFERENLAAREALADMYWDQYLREEEEGSVEEMILYENLVREYNTGQYDDRLKGNGWLSVTAFHYPCRCLVAGREVPPEEMDAAEYHPFSGRSLRGHKGAEGLPTLEPDGPVSLKVHGPECWTEPLEGADAWLFRYEESRRLLHPGFPRGVSRGRPSSTVEATGPAADLDDVLDRLFDATSPFRPNEGLYLGRTPVPEFSLPMGSYLLVLARPEFRPVRVPVFIGRLAEEDVDVVLYRDGEVPEGFVQVPAGKFIYQGDRGNPYAGPKEILETEDFFLAEVPVTCSDYLAFLNDLASLDPAEAERRVPRKAPTTGAYWPHDERGRYHIPTEAWLEDAPKALRGRAAKLDMCPVWWEADWPVFGVSWEDLVAYGAWRSREASSLFSLPPEVLWEKAARGTDGRLHPGGHTDEMDPSYSNTSGSHEDQPRPSTVRDFPADESPYGIKGMGGNSRDLCLNDPGEQYAGWRLSRGGNWHTSGLYNRSASRTGDMTTVVFYTNGGRLAWFPRTKNRWRPASR